MARTYAVLIPKETGLLHRKVQDPGASAHHVHARQLRHFVPLPGPPTPAASVGGEVIEDCQ
jgi:hypothetical protein